MTAALTDSLRALAAGWTSRADALRGAVPTVVADGLRERSTELLAILDKHQGAQAPAVTADEIAFILAATATLHTPLTDSNGRWVCSECPWEQNPDTPIGLDAPCEFYDHLGRAQAHALRPLLPTTTKQGDHA